MLQVGKEVAHPGIANDFNDDDAQKYYTYYQWVCFVLFFQVKIVFKFLEILRLQYKVELSEGTKVVNQCITFETQYVNLEMKAQDSY